MNLAHHLTSSAARFGADAAIVCGDETWTYADLDAASARVAGALVRGGTVPGDRVAVMLPNVPEFAAVYYGALRAGAIVVPMNPLLKEREVAYYLADSGPGVLFAASTVAEVAHAGAAASGARVTVVDPGAFVAALGEEGPLEQVVERKEGDTAVILYTSGTTGRPKGAELTHANLVRNADLTVRTLLTLTPDDVVFGGLPLFHTFGQTCALNTTIMAGATIALLPRFGAQEALEAIAAQRVTVFAGVPTMYSALLGVPDHRRYDTSSLRVCISGGAALPVEVLHRFEDEFGCIILEGYGLSETSPVAAFNHPDRVRKPGSIGTAVEGVEVRVVGLDGEEVPSGEVGEIAVRGHNIMKGYWKRPDATAEAIRDGWFLTGDMGRIDEDGCFSIVDRKKDLIIRGGYNVYPREVEEVLYEHPAVAEAAVIGVPHAELGEEVAAVVALASPGAATAEELRDFVKSQVAAYKYPREVRIVDQLPKGPTGKILKRELRAGSPSPAAPAPPASQTL
ncbi:long-chain-fatty-acid--CoA ligase [Sinomonas cyclohexanicum]|uniref:Long-chain-fatty-acid--CoA ligase n=1 Tax=Sinomonas cyclohexanicum TaxID=322009 RepID=A0ABM7PST5_SINCY|nr:long-chain fatty acid--CoA ligase [Corynebacterium cyclohexanicum]BCT75285.1 long-chain-fatty-acid--CoA ligase [Corynebacterium cyclohexanicum]